MANYLVAEIAPMSFGKMIALFAVGVFFATCSVTYFVMTTMDRFQSKMRFCACGAGFYQERDGIVRMQPVVPFFNYLCTVVYRVDLIQRGADHACGTDARCGFELCPYGRP